MSLWGATVITNLMSAIPWIGQDIVEFIWGGFSVNNATLNRFFALHFVLPFILAALALMHLIALHDSAGSGNPLGVSGNYDRLPFAPYFLFKDLITIFLFILVLSVFVFFMPNVLGDSENYVMANPMQTPPAIVPDWYLLPFYAILRSIPNKLLGVIAMFSAILILLAMPFTDLSKSRGIQFRPLSKIAFFIFIANFLILMQLGAKHVESPFIEFGQISTVIYFGYFLIIVPLGSLLDNSLIELASKKYARLSISVEATENYSPAKPFAFLSLPMQSGIILNFARLFFVIKKKFTFRYIISVGIAIIFAWFIRSYLISKGANLSVFWDFFYTTGLASIISAFIKVGIDEFFLNYCASTGGGGGNMPGSGNTTGNPWGNIAGNPVGNTTANPVPANAPAAGNASGTSSLISTADNGAGGNDWGPANQVAASRNNPVPLRIHGSGFVYNPSGSNQPFATNLADALAFQRDGNTNPRLSRYVLNNSDVNFLERFLFFNDRDLHSEFKTSNTKKPYNWDALMNNADLRKRLRQLP